MLRTHAQIGLTCGNAPGEHGRPAADIRASLAAMILRQVSTRTWPYRKKYWRVEPLFGIEECTAVAFVLFEVAMRKHRRNVAHLCGNVIGFEKSHDASRQLL